MLDEEEKDILDDEEENESQEEVVEEAASDTNDEAIEELEDGIVPGLADTGLVSQVKQSFLDYAMSVIVSRAIPDVRDGLKPVHRRIIFGMNELGMFPDKPFRKCARIVGDVMGKYHPHGDSSIYMALARLAQPFAIRYTLVEGHGNFGSIDGDEPAAMRYTEARMSKIALEMVRDIKKDTVDMMPNYDGEEEEPVVVPSRIPNLLLNGSSGIAVGMATNIPPHNLRETVNAIIAISKNPEITIDELMSDYLHGPDFPTGGLILGRSGIRKAYETGTGSIIIRSRTEIEEHENGKKRIIITEIPYGVNKALCVETIGRMVREKTIDGITAIRDESNKEGIRVVIEVRKDIVPEVLLNQLFKQTQLQTSFGIINLCLVNGEPKILSITKMLQYYLDFQCDVIERRTRFDLKKDKDQLHILEGLLKAQENIDDVVKIIRTSANIEDAKNALIAKYEFSEVQTKAILEMRLSKLVHIEKDAIINNINHLKEEIAIFEDILSSKEHVVNKVVEELEEIKAKYGDERRTEISNASADIDDEDLIPEEDIVITLSNSGYIKRLSADSFRTQNRGGVGIAGTKLNKDDITSIITYTKTHTDILFFSNKGKVYRTRGYVVPEMSRTSKGLPVQNLIPLEDNEKVVAIISIDNNKDKEEYDNMFLLFATRQGVVKRTALGEFESIRQNGKIAITMREDDEIVGVKLTNGQALVTIAATNGKMVKFEENDVRPMGRTATGVRGMNIGEGERCISVNTSLEGNLVLSLSENGYGKLTPLEEYRLTSRGGKGVTTLNMTDKTGLLVSTQIVNGDEDVIIITKNGVVIRTSLSQVSTVGRNTQGVRIIKLSAKDSVSSLTTVDKEEVEEDNMQEPTNTEQEAIVAEGENK